MLTLSVLVLLLVLSLAAKTEAAYPHYVFSGCKYDPSTIDPISYRFYSVHSDSEEAFKDAEEEWDATAAPGSFVEYSYSLDPEINVTDTARSDDFPAWYTYECNDNTGLYKGNEVNIDFNTNVINSYSANDKKIVAMHEIGHAYGLDHVSFGCRLMRGTGIIYTCLTEPIADDVDGVEALYP